jgi:hypothetical protein
MFKIVTIVDGTTTLYALLRSSSSQNLVERTILVNSETFSHFLVIVLLLDEECLVVVEI